MEVKELLEQMAQMGSATDRAGMARFGINATNAFGIRIPELRKLARTIGKDAELAAALWQTGFHEARLLAVFIFPKNRLDVRLMEGWISEVNSWDLCDQACQLFCNHPDAFQMAAGWSSREALFEKRAGFALMACLAVHARKATDEDFVPFFSCIRAGATDSRNFVKKAVNWALRQIGKRSVGLHRNAVAAARLLLQTGDKTAAWIAQDALRELSEPGRLPAILAKETRRNSMRRKG